MVKEKWGVPATLRVVGLVVVAAAPFNLDLSSLMPRDVPQISIPILPIGNRDSTLAYPYPVPH